MELYKISEVNQHKYYKIPKDLCENPCYKHALSSDAKLIYALLLDRMELSRKNKWVNDRGEIFLLYTKENIAEILGITESTIYKAFRILEACKLVKQERQGINLPNKIYIGKVDLTFSIASIPQLARTCKICRSGCVNYGGQDLQNMQGSETEFSETEINETESIHLEDVKEKYLSCYINEYRSKFGKDHPRVTEDQIIYIEQSIKSIKEYDVQYYTWAKTIKTYFNNLPADNNGNILAFLKASYRFFEVNLVAM
jgi:DNA-binding transcriptional ArsR family regulator